MAPKGRSTAAGSGADTRTYRAAYGQPKTFDFMSMLKSNKLGMRICHEGEKNILPSVAHNLLPEV